MVWCIVYYVKSNQTYRFTYRTWVLQNSLFASRRKQEQNIDIPFHIFVLFFSAPVAVQNERDRISVRRTAFEDMGQNSALSVQTLLQAELMSRQVRNKAH